MSIAPPSARPTTGDRPASTTASPPSERAGASADAKRPDPTPRDVSRREDLRNNEIAFDEKSGLMVVRTVAVATGEIVGQNPSEAYLRLAHAMIETLRSGGAEGTGADVLA